MRKVEEIRLSCDIRLMKMKIFLTGFLLLLVSTVLYTQELEIEPSTLDFGQVEAAGSLRSMLILKNTGNKVLYLLRADSPKGLDIYTSSKKILPGDTLHLRFLYIPLNAGRISEEISLLHTASDKPQKIKIKGELMKLLGNDLAACVNFEPKTNQDSQLALIPVLASHEVVITDAITGKPIPLAELNYRSTIRNESADRPINNGISKNTIPIGPYEIKVKAAGYAPQTEQLYIGASGARTIIALEPIAIEPLASQTQEKPEIKPQKPLQIEETASANPDVFTELDERLYKANNLIFLVDVSGSMKSEDKLPLLKQSIYTLLQPVRPIDKISVVAYSTEAEIVVKPSSGNLKNEIYANIDTMQAGGKTAGSEGLQKAYRLAKESYIKGGNNRIILATDGAFRVSGKERKLIEEAANDKESPIFLTIVAFGSKDEGLGMLQALGKLGGGNVVEVKKSRQAERVLLDEIKNQSRK